MTQREVIFQALKEYVDRQLVEVDRLLAEIREIQRSREKRWELPQVTPGPEKGQVN